MSERKPVLMSIHDRFDTFDRYPYTDHSVISRVKYSSREDGYTVKTYAGGLGNAYDGLVIDVQLESGKPVAAFLGRDWGGLMKLNIDAEEVMDPDSGLTKLTGKVDRLPQGTRVVVTAGQEGFALIQQLHDGLSGVRSNLNVMLQNRSDLEIEFSKDGVFINRTNSHSNGNLINLNYDMRSQVEKLFRE